jgi:LuxR family transcriptional regulator, quorum-sensing system regulator BjaR1
MVANAARQWGTRAFDFVDAIERLNAPAVVKLFESEINACGFHAYLHPPLSIRTDAGLAGPSRCRASRDLRSRPGCLTRRH